MFEKKRGKRFLASVMALVMLLSLAPVGALATEDEGQPAENQPVAQSAVESKDQTNENTPTEPAKDSDSAEATKSEGDFDESFSADEDDADTSNDIAVQDLSLSNSTREQSITAEYWVTNAKVSVAGSNDMTISQNYNGITEEDGVSVEDLAPEAGTQGDNTAIFWQARVLSYNNYQTEDGGVNQTSKGTEIQKIRYYDGKFQYQAKNSTAWTDFNTWEYWKDQLVFYYLIKTDFAQNIQINVSDWPVTKCPTDRPEYRQLSYKVLVKTADGTETSIDSEDTYYYSGVDISNIQVRMNDLSQYKIDSIEITNPYTNPTVSRNGAGSDFSLNLSEVPAESTVTIKIYVTPYKYTVKYLLDGKPYKATTSYEAGQSVTVESDPTKPGYTFSSWSTSDVDVVISNNMFTMPARNVEFTASWEPSTNTAYTVKHFLQNLDDSYPTEASETEMKSGTTGENTAATAKSYTGFTAQSFAQKTIAADGSTVVEIKYERNKHDITYQITGDNFAQNNYKTVENVPFGSTLSLISNDMTKDGYTFSGWNGLPTTMPDNNVTVTGSYTKNDVGPVAPPTDPDTDLVDAMYFVLMPGQGVPNSGVSRGVDKYFPNASNNGGVTGKSNTTGYEGKITKAATELTGANTSNGYFDKNGVGDQYLKDIGDLGYFNGSNYTDGKYKDTLPDGLKDFNMTNKEIVWYVIKKEGNDYHVDGYVKGVNIELKYFDEFDGTQIGETTSLLSGGTATIKALPSEVVHNGWRFAGWFTKDGTNYEVGSTHTLIDSLNLYARWTATYDVVTHFMGANGIEQKDLRQTSKNLTGTHGKLLSELVVQPKNITGNYVYAPSETKYSVGNGDKVSVGTTTFTTANTVIHQYYYLDETGETGKDKENKPTDKPDGIPDAWQHKVTFKVVNGKWNDDSSDNIVVYVNAKDKDGETLESKLTEAQIPAVGEKPNSGYRASGSWDKSLSAGLKITGDTEFTFTYSRRSSGGSSRPSTPTVTIPDDVPTGLNGKDHYAYIIGYGNNDVRPQNNITRAEVATIFFRLLTDETREANMTKSNGYNDVKDGDWFCCAVSTLSKMGIIKGYEDGSFKPNDPISRAEFAAIAARFDPDGDKTPATFADVTSHWAKDEISIAANHGWIKGYEDGSFKPDQKITRAETMTLVNRVLNRLPETKDDLHKDMKTWVDNMDETAWYYLAVQEATNSHYFKNKTGTKFEQWTDLRDTRDWSELEK